MRYKSREKQGLEIYNEILIPNRWRKEFEPVDDDTDIHVVQTSTLINKRKKPEANSKTTIDKFNKAIVVCRDLATFLSMCGENEFLEKMTVLKNPTRIGSPHKKLLIQMKIYQTLIRFQ